MTWLIAVLTVIVWVAGTLLSLIRLFGRFRYSEPGFPWKPCLVAFSRRWLGRGICL